MNFILGPYQIRPTCRVQVAEIAEEAILGADVLSAHLGQWN